MNPYCAFDLDAHTGSCYLEFCAGRHDGEDKFKLAGSLFVADNAFFALDVNTALCMAVPGFDMFGDNLVTREQWRQAYRISGEMDEETRDVMEEINRWAVRIFLKEEAFSVLGV